MIKLTNYVYSGFEISRLEEVVWWYVERFEIYLDSGAYQIPDDFQTW